MKKLRGYQKEAAKKICEFANSEKDKAKIYISTGLGKTDIIVSALREILTNGSKISIAILAKRRIICDQIKMALFEMDENINVASRICELTEEKIMITTYQDIISNQLSGDIFDLIICDEAQFVKSEDYFELLIKKGTKFLGLLQNIESSEGWFKESACLFSYTTRDAVRDGYVIYAREQEFIQRFLVKLLDYQGYKDISNEVEITDGYKGSMRVDIVAKKENETAVIEVKSYRGLYNSKAIINTALRQILQYRNIISKKDKDKAFSFIIVLPCKVDEEEKNEIYNQSNVIIWDINNLIYLCEDNRELLQLLSSCIPYPFSELKAKEPLGIVDEEKDIIIDEPEVPLAETYMKRLENCKPGKLNKADIEFERICTEIIKYLFGTEFFRISEQHKTDDEMFRMDLLCSLKGTTEFWKFLISFYKTKFVVFEYKNYSDFIAQNLIYITEKYLFPVALRNVAFIISRKGFNLNAKKAALGCLRESGKLIISLDDNDLIKMLAMKKNGEEPSDYLLDKVEQLLMSVSK